MYSLKGIFFLFLILLSGNTIISQELKINTTEQNPKELQYENAIEFTDSKIFKPSKLTDYNLLASIDTTNANTATAVYPPVFRDYRRLGYDTGMFLGATVVAFGVLWALPESVSNWDKEDIRENGITNKWKQNVKAGPVWDNDDWVLNWVTHPYSGGVYYMTARSSGFNIFESFLYSAFMSTFFWEYGIEAFAEIPSIQDLIITPVVGSIIGEGFFYAKKSIMKHDKRILKSRVLGYTTLFVIDPFNTMLDSFGYKERQKTQLNVAPIGFDKGANQAIWGIDFKMSF